MTGALTSPSSNEPACLCDASRVVLHIVYFAWVRERMGIGEENVSPPPAIDTVPKLVRWIAARDHRGAFAFADPDRIRAAIDGEMSHLDASISGAAEIALFPPVTGG